MCNISCLAFFTQQDAFEFISVAVCIRTLFFFLTKKHSIVQMDHRQLIPLTVDRQIGRFQFGAFMNKVTPSP